MMKRFRDRSDAGEQLASMLQQAMSQEECSNAVLLALPRGGVPVAHVMAKRLSIPMDLLLVRKIGAPFNDEFAIGAMAEGNVLVLDEGLIEALNVQKNDLQRIIQKEQQELIRRRKNYCANCAPLSLSNKHAIIVDDGIATGTTMLAAIERVHQQKPLSVWIAVPVAARDSLLKLFPEVNCIVCVLKPETLSSVGEWYENFAQLSDEEVREFLL
jgi:putative phosphoribosyl transferase